MKKQVMCVIGTRGEVVKLAPVVHLLEESPLLKPIVVSTGQYREMVDQAIGCFQIRVDYDLNLTRPKLSLGEQTSLMIAGMDQALNKFPADLMLVQGDTLTVLTASLAAYYHKVPVGHIEAGLRTADRYNPFAEEMYRRLTSQLATLHFASTQRAVENLQRESITKRVYLSGNTVIDALMEAVNRLKMH